MSLSFLSSTMSTSSHGVVWHGSLLLFTFWNSFSHLIRFSWILHSLSRFFCVRFLVYRFPEHWLWWFVCVGQFCNIAFCNPAIRFAHLTGGSIVWPCQLGTIVKPFFWSILADRAMLYLNSACSQVPRTSPNIIGLTQTRIAGYCASSTDCPVKVLKIQQKSFFILMSCFFGVSW